jgi:hypothetical protein
MPEGESADLREFIREMTLRFERTTRALIAEMREDRAEARAERQEAGRKLDVILAEIRDLRGESRARTQALLRMLDRLGDGGAAPAG